MDKALKKVHDSILKQDKSKASAKEQQQHLTEQIEKVKTDIKNNAKKGIVDSILKRDDSDKLAKLLAEKEIVDLQLEVVESLGYSEAIEKAIVYIDKVQEREAQMKQDIQEAYDKAKQKKEEAEKEMQQNGFMQKMNVSSGLLSEAKRNLLALSKEVNMNGCKDLKELKQLLETYK